MTNYKITQVRSLIGSTKAQRKVMVGLGITKIRSHVVVKHSSSIDGILKKIGHLVKVEEVSEKKTKGKVND